MADKVPEKAYVEGASGKAFSVTKEQAGDLDEGGFKATGVSKEQALASTQADHDAALAMEHGGQAGAFINNLSKYALPGGAATRADIWLTEHLQGKDSADLKRHVMAGADHLTGGTIGDLVGMYAGAKLLPVGDKISALVPEAKGILGAAMRGGAGAAADGALIGLGQASAEAAIENKDLTSEALLAHTTAGMLYGGGIGTVLGGLGGAAKGILRKGAGAVASASGKEAVGASLAKEMGASPNTLSKIAAEEGGIDGFLKPIHEAAQKEGLTMAELSRDPKRLGQIASKLEAQSAKAAMDIAKEADTTMSGPKNWNGHAPKWQSLYDGIKDELAAKAMAPGGIDIAKDVTTWFERNAPAPGPANMQNWVKGRSQINWGSLPEEYATQLKTRYDQMLFESLDAQAMARPELEGITGRLRSAMANQRIAQTAAEIADAKAMAPNKSLLSATDMTTGAMLAVGGSPVSAATFLASKAGIRAVAEKFGPQMAEALWHISQGNQASGAVASLKGAVKEAVSSFFKASELGATKAAKGNFNRKAFDTDLEQTYKAVTVDPKERFNQYVQETRSMALADAMTKAHKRAADYLMPIMPPAPQAQAAGKLRKVPTAVGLTIAEHMFKRQQGVAKNPLAVLEDLQQGTLSKETVKGMKAMWPQTHGLIVSEVKEQILKAQQSGNSMPIGKITQLSILLDSPLDNTMTPGFIQPVQMALNEPITPPQAPSQPAPSTENPDSYATPSEGIL